MVVAEGNKPYTYREIADALRAEGISLSRARWAYMLNGEGPLVTNEALLGALARFFQVDPGYLVGADDDLPERIDSQLRFIRALRARRVRNFAARTLHDVSPDTLRSITALLERDIAAEGGA